VRCNRICLKLNRAIGCLVSKCPKPKRQR